MTNRCGSCDAIMHDFTTEEALQCVPPPYILQFKDLHIKKEYRQALYDYCPYFTVDAAMMGIAVTTLKAMQMKVVKAMKAMKVSKPNMA